MDDKQALVDCLTQIGQRKNYVDSNSDNVLICTTYEHKNNQERIKNEID